MSGDPLVLPSLRGTFGSWIYYVCTMPVHELGSRALYAEEIHPDKALSQLIQRSLEGPRARHIAQYLSSTEERFFNSLVLATYGGSPDWLEVGNFRSPGEPSLVKQISENALDSVGFLRLTGKEKIFALDGQHRLAGIKRALATGMKFENEMVPVVFVGHRKDAKGLQRTRRLFTTLNKTAIPVRKKDIIALDEDDVMAITVRRLVEGNLKFKHPKIAVIDSRNLPTANRVSLTTIANLYDTLRLVFMHQDGQRTDRLLRFDRPSDERLDNYYASAIAYFEALEKAFPPMRKLFDSANPGKVTEAHRGPTGGHLLFRPVGLEVITRSAIACAKERDLAIPAAVKCFAGIPTDLAKPPFRHVLWNPSSHRVIVQGKALALALVSYMIGLDVDAGKLIVDYRQFIGADEDDAKVKLPERIG